MKQNGHYLKLYIKKEQENREVLSFLYGEMGLTTRKIRSVKQDSHGILLDGNRVTVRTKVRSGQLLEVLLNDSEEKEERLVPVKMELDILYEDEDLLFVNKPAGMVCHPSKGHYADSLANGIMGYFRDKGERSHIHLIGRLDKDTSGIVGIAKNGVVSERMQTEMGKGKCQKEYLALVKGRPPQQEQDISISMKEYRDEADGNRLKMGKGEKDVSKKAGTHYRVIWTSPDKTLSLCRITLETGRTHQIRFHMSAIGYPLLGDPLYGDGTEKGMERAALHAHKMSVIHPFTKEKILLEVAMPKDMKQAMDAADECGA